MIRRAANDLCMFFMPVEDKKKPPWKWRLDLL
jgi:hypothetical protein